MKELPGRGAPAAPGPHPPYKPPTPAVEAVRVWKAPGHHPPASPDLPTPVGNPWPPTVSRLRETSLAPYPIPCVVERCAGLLRSSDPGRRDTRAGRMVCQKQAGRGAGRRRSPCERRCLGRKARLPTTNQRLGSQWAVKAPPEVLRLPRRLLRRAVRQDDPPAVPFFGSCPHNGAGLARVDSLVRHDVGALVFLGEP